jgi:hypothetical protein
MVEENRAFKNLSEKFRNSKTNSENPRVAGSIPALGTIKTISRYYLGWSKKPRKIGAFFVCCSGLPLLIYICRNLLGR